MPLTAADANQLLAGAARGRLKVQVSGLPRAARARIQVIGPRNYFARVSKTTTRRVAPGRYHVRPGPITYRGQRYTAFAHHTRVRVRLAHRAKVRIHYTKRTPAINPSSSGRGQLRVRMTGLPPDAKARVVIKGPQNYRKRLTKMTTLKRLKKGRYRILTSPVTFGGSLYVASADHTRVKVRVGHTSRVWIDHAKVRPGTQPRAPEEGVGGEDPPKSSPSPSASPSPETTPTATPAPTPTPSTTPSAPPTPPTPSAVSIDAGEDHTCAVLSTGVVRCWGANANGQLGDGSQTDSARPVTVTGITSARAITGGDGFTCARLADSSLRCWGRNDEGQLGNGTGGDGTDAHDSSVPVTVLTTGATPLTGVLRVANGQLHACAVTSNGDTHCWGRNNRGQLGLSTAGPSQPSAVKADAFGPSPIQPSAGEEFSCVLLQNGSVGCWGSNDLGRLGDGTDLDRLIPVGVSMTHSATHLTSGTAHSCAVLAGSVQCWGDNTDGQLNGNHDPTPPDTSAEPPVASGVSGATAASAGAFHTCAVLADERVRCWGANWAGQLGQGNSTADLPGSYLVDGLTNVQLLTAAGSHTCAISADGNVRCWGGNASGQAGPGLDPVLRPQLVPLG